MSYSQEQLAAFRIYNRRHQEKLNKQAEAIAKDKPVPVCECGCGLPCRLVKRDYPSKGLKLGDYFPRRAGHYDRGALSSRFWEKVSRNGPVHLELGTECWIWVSPTVDAGGYAKMTVARKGKKASHVAWFLQYGKWPEKNMCHKCDNPLCVRWDHLFEGTHQDNSDDMARKGRVPRGEAHHQAILTEEQVCSIKKLWAGGEHTLRGLAEDYCVSKGCISNIVYGHRWRHVNA